MKRLFISFIVFLSVFDLAFSATKTSFDTAVWIPYWHKDEGASSTLEHLSSVSQISPFAYGLQPDGTIKDSMKINEEPWTTLFSEARKNGIKIYPTILSYPHNDTEQYDQWLLLAQRKKRNAHIANIVSLVKKNNFDGIDIDYEAKLASTKDYFSEFLTGLSRDLHKINKKLICTIEARTPPEDRYATTSPEVLSKVEYANDYKVIGKVCDQVRIMTYDQMNDDQALSIFNSDFFYKPVSDLKWVMKVLNLAMFDIPKNKILIGLPTYGYKFEVTPATGSSSIKYSRVGSMNYNYATEIAKSARITPFRNQAMELSYSYATSTSYDGNFLGGIHQYLVWYSDATSWLDKIRIAKLYGIRGVAVFKIDGGQDPSVWDVLK